MRHQLFFISDPAYYHHLSEAKKYDYVLSSLLPRGLSDYITALASLHPTNFTDNRPPHTETWQSPYSRRPRMLTLSIETIANLAEIIIHHNVMTPADPSTYTPAFPRAGTTIPALAGLALELIGINYLAPLDHPPYAPFRRTKSRKKRTISRQRRSFEFNF
jgi:hypothetical protein